MCASVCLPACLYIERSLAEPLLGRMEFTSANGVGGFPFVSRKWPLKCGKLCVGVCGCSQGLCHPGENVLVGPALVLLYIEMK